MSYSLTGYLCSGYYPGVELPFPQGVGKQAITAYTSGEHSAWVDSGSNSCQLCELGLNAFVICMMTFILDPLFEFAMRAKTMNFHKATIPVSGCG